MQSTDKAGTLLLDDTTPEQGSSSSNISGGGGGGHCCCGTPQCSAPAKPACCSCCPPSPLDPAVVATARTHATAAYTGMNRTDPDAIWYYQGEVHAAVKAAHKAEWFTTTV